MTGRRKKPTLPKPGARPPLRRSFTKGQRDLGHVTNRTAFRRLDSQAQANALFNDDPSAPPGLGGGRYGY